MLTANFSDNFDIECLGEQEIDVYDIEVEDNHNFFANDICVHNSTYIRMEDIVSKYSKSEDVFDNIKYLNMVCENIIQPALKVSFDKIVNQMNCYDNRIRMAREVIASRAVWTSKKHYIIAVYDDGGITFSKPKFKIMGMESQRSSTPEFCRNFLKKSYEIVLTQSEKDMQKYYKQSKKEFFALPIEGIAKPTGVSNIDKFYDPSTLYIKGTPIHCRGSLIYNKLIHDKNLEKHLTPIKSGDKIKVVYLKMPNPTKENVISFPDFLDQRLGLDEYVDKKKMFDNNLLTPLKTVLDVVGWQPERKTMLRFKQ